MSTPVKLSAIIEELDFQSDERHSYVNRKTGEIVSVSNEDLSAAEEDVPLENFPAWQQKNVKLAGAILESEDYLKLPGKFAINDYHIMEEFFRSIQDPALSEKLYDSIKGSGAFRRFKDNIHRVGIEQEWYKFRNAALGRIAIRWCEAHEIPFTEG